MAHKRTFKRGQVKGEKSHDPRSKRIRPGGRSRREAERKAGVSPGTFRLAGQGPDIFTTSSISQSRPGPRGRIVEDPRIDPVTGKPRGRRIVPPAQPRPEDVGVGGTFGFRKKLREAEREKQAALPPSPQPTSPEPQGKSILKSISDFFDFNIQEEEQLRFTMDEKGNIIDPLTFNELLLKGFEASAGIAGTPASAALKARQAFSPRAGQFLEKVPLVETGTASKEAQRIFSEAIKSQKLRADTAKLIKSQSLARTDASRLSAEVQRMISKTGGIGVPRNSWTASRLMKIFGITAVGGIAIKAAESTVFNYFFGVQDPTAPVSQAHADAKNNLDFESMAELEAVMDAMVAFSESNIAKIPIIGSLAAFIKVNIPALKALRNKAKRDSERLQTEGVTNELGIQISQGRLIGYRADLAEAKVDLAEARARGFSKEQITALENQIKELNLLISELEKGLEGG